MNLDATLAQLEAAQIVRRLAEEQATYAFKHSLTQETVYHALLKTRRRELHRAVAEAIEQTFADRLEEMGGVLAYHWEHAEVPDRARHYLYLASQRAAQRYATPEALALLTRALALIADAPAHEIVLLYRARAQVYEFLSQYAEAMNDYTAALQGARTAGRLDDECEIMARIAWLRWLSGRGAAAVEIAQEVEHKARDLPDRSVGLRAYLVTGLVRQADGHIAEAYPRLRQALFFSRASGERALEGESLFFLGIQNNFMGRFGRAVACARAAHAIKASLRDRVGEIVSMYLRGRAEGGRGCYDAALDALQAGHAVAEETQNPFGIAQYPNTRAWLSAELGDWQTAYEFDRAGLEVARAAPVRPPEISTLINLVLDCAHLGRLDEADQFVLQLHQWMGRSEFGFHAWRWQMRFADARARLLIANSLFDEAQPVVDELLDWAGRTASAKYRARGLMLRARLRITRGDSGGAKVDLTAARGLADVMGYLPVQIQARRALAELGDQAGTAAPERYREQAAQLVTGLGQSLKHPDLRRSFERGIGSLSSRVSNGA